MSGVQRATNRTDVVKAALLLGAGLLLGGTIPLLRSWWSLDAARLPFLFLGVITLPLVVSAIYVLVSPQADLFAPGVFFPVYWWLHAGWGTFLFMLDPISSLELPLLVPILNALAMYAYFGGLLLAQAFLGAHRPRIAVLERAALLFRNWSPGRLAEAVAAGTLLALAGAALYYKRAGGIPLLFENVQQGRVQAVWGNAYAAFLIFSLSYFYLVYWARQVASGKSVLNPVLIGLFLLVVLLNASIGYRRPIVWFVVSLIIAYHYLGRSLKVRHLLAVGLVLLALVIVAGLWRTAVSREGQAFSISLGQSLRYGERLFKRATVGFVVVTDIFPEQVSFRLGQTYLSPFYILLPGHQEDFTNWLKRMAGMEYEGGGLGPSLVGEFYLNFGIPGAVVGPLLLGVFFSLAYRWMRAYPSLLRVSLYAVLTRGIAQAGGGGFSGINTIYTLWGIALVLAIHWYVYRPVERVVSAKGA
jgi:oligosaccharide repeat unit polymerase